MRSFGRDVPGVVAWCRTWLSKPPSAKWSGNTRGPKSWSRHCKLTGLVFGWQATLTAWAIRIQATVNFATRALSLSIPAESGALWRWYDAVAARPGATVLSSLAPYRRGWWHGVGFPRISAGRDDEGLVAMGCVGCGSAAVTERPDLTAQGYRRFPVPRLRQAVQRAQRRCSRVAAERRHRVRGVLPAALRADPPGSQRDPAVARIHRQHECVRKWEAKLLPVMGEALRKRCRGTA
jgi:hypothetical protein